MGYRYCLLAVAAVVSTLGLGLIEIGAHCPNMARIARSRLGPHLDPLGPLLGQPHEQRHAGRHAVQFGVVLVAALELFA